jgi:hypothetical protein
MLGLFRVETVGIEPTTCGLKDRHSYSAAVHECTPSLKNRAGRGTLSASVHHCAPTWLQIGYTTPTPKLHGHDERIGAVVFLLDSTADQLDDARRIGSPVAPRFLRWAKLWTAAYFLDPARRRGDNARHCWRCLQARSTDTSIAGLWPHRRGPRCFLLDRPPCARLDSSRSAIPSSELWANELHHGPGHKPGPRCFDTSATDRVQRRRGLAVGQVLIVVRLQRWSPDDFRGRLCDLGIC